ncbi:nitroreductase family protein [Dysgonomonas sp. ZJ709]|uniref:nitroreductase family protein n=1 Tax=Dysgonomonas sp. ZJ709 TaxID=2709797 RepID=UPI0013EC0BEF|nr:nitroreductase family protein [Dysgonomonas sp. ZJ709]
MKQIIKGILPKIISDRITLFLAYKHDFERFYKYSATQKMDNRIKLLGKIIKDYHVIEKGLTMPTPRLGFGQDKVVILIANCLLYLSKYDNDEAQLKHAISVLLEYKEIHDKDNHQLKTATLKSINQIVLFSKQMNITQTKQKKVTKEEYFQSIGNPFLEFSNSRKSIRNYSSMPLSVEKLLNVIELTRNTPSACNRQAYRVYIYTKKEQIEKIFTIQNGNRGFGHLADKLIVITAELGVFADPMERNQAYIDGGIYSMNLLYSLHFHRIGACILNCSNTPRTDRELQEVCETKKSEVFISMVACGYPPNEFSYALSERLLLNNICTVK